MSYENTIKYAEKFNNPEWKPMPYFHLRPKSDGATLVCTIAKEKIAMRGKTSGVWSFLIGKGIDKLYEINPGKLNDEAILDKLCKMGFSERKSQKYEYEKLVQAMFINLMQKSKDALSDCGFKNVHFIASEFIYLKSKNDKRRFVDVIAESDKGILLIEIKEGPDINPSDNPNQLKDYEKFYFDENRDITLKLLKNYPNHSLSKDKKVIPIYLLAEGDNKPKVAGEDVTILRYCLDENKSNMSIRLGQNLGG